MVEIKNYDPACVICNLLKTDDTGLVYDGNLNAVLIYPRENPHPFRVAVVPKRHLGEDGMYCLDLLSGEEREECNSLSIKMTDAILSALEITGNEPKRTKEGLPLINQLIRPSTHPNLDHFVQTEGAARIGSYVFPRYHDDEIESNSSGVRVGFVIVASFANAPPKPKDLITKEAKILKKNLRI